MSADAQTPPAEDAPPSAMKRHLPFVLALVLGLGAGGASGAFFVGPAMAKGIAPAGVAVLEAEHRAAAAKAAESPEEGKAGEGKKGAKDATQVYTLDNLVLNPAESGGSRFLLLSIAFEVTDPTIVEEMKTRDAELRDAVLVTLGAKTVEQLADMRSRDAVKAELVAATQKLFKKKSSVARVYFPQFVIQ
jgi:flagellar FliL protein